MLVLVTAPVSTCNRWCDFYVERNLTLPGLLCDMDSGIVDRDDADTAEDETGMVLVFVST